MSATAKGSSLDAVGVRPQQDLRLLVAAAGAWAGAWFSVADPLLAAVLSAAAAIGALGAIVHVFARTGRRSITVSAAQARAVASALIRGDRVGGSPETWLATAMLFLVALSLTSGISAVRGAERVPEALHAASQSGTHLARMTLTGLARSDAQSMHTRAELTVLDAEPISVPVLVFMPVADALRSDDLRSDDLRSDDLRSDDLHHGAESARPGARPPEPGARPPDPGTSPPSTGTSTSQSSPSTGTGTGTGTSTSTSTRTSPGSSGADALSPGTEVEVRVRIQLAEPGDDIVALAFADGPVRVLAPPAWPLSLGAELRDGFVALAAPLPRPGGALVPGLAVGDERLVDDQLSEAMAVTSLTHLTAVSGANIAIVVAAAVAIGRAAGMRRALRLAVGALALAGFVVLVTPQGSVIRAGAMALIVLLADARSRPLAGVPVLGLAVTVLIVADPWLARDYGFALSAAATAGLLLGTRPLARALERWLPPPLAVVIAVPFAAQLACQPILLLLDSRIPLWSVSANLLAAPAAPIATVLGLIACVVGVVIPALGAVLIWPAWCAATWIGAIAEAFSALPGATAPWVPGPLGAVLWILMTVIALVLLLRWGPRHLRRCLAALTAIGLVVMISVVTATEWQTRSGLPPHWRYGLCDVGQGDAVLIQADGRIALIDTGDDPELLATCLQRLGVDRIDLLIISHFDRDHIGAADSIDLPISAALLPDTLEARDEPLAAALSRRGATVAFAAAGDGVRFGDLRVSALWPRRTAQGQPSHVSGNDASLVIRADPVPGECLSDCLRMISLGDLGREPQEALIRSGVPVAADVIKIAHHGSRDTSDRLTGMVDAELAFVSVGADNGYGHPTNDALDQLRAAGTPWWRTDLLGTVVVSGGDAGEPITVWSPDGRPLRMDSS